MTNRQISNPLRVILVGTILCVALIIPETWIAELITKNNPEVFVTCFTRMLAFSMCVYVIISIIAIVKLDQLLKKHKQETLEKAKKALNSEFKTVLLNNSGDISKEMFECQAKIDDNGKILCKIHLDLEKEIDSYEEFLNYFHFTEK